MHAFELADVLSATKGERRAYEEFLRVPALSMGLYRLPAGGTDLQAPHTEDEVYYVVSGQARIRVADEDVPVNTGSIVYVPKHVPHAFHSIEEGLTILVFFSPAEYSNQPK